MPIPERSGAASQNSYKFAGREDDGSGLYYYRARYYHPRLQRFISEDPIGFRGGMPLYAYVANDPTRFRDPLGLQVAAPVPGPPIPFPLPPIAIPGSSQNQQAVQATAEAFRKLKDAVGQFCREITGDDEKKRCEKVRQQRIEGCSETHLPTRDYGFTFWNCVNDCLRRSGCL